MPPGHLTCASRFPETERWFHASVRFHDWAAAERITADIVGPRLDVLTASAASRWWFLRKHPHWRIRIAGTEPVQAANLFSQLADQEIIDDWHQEIYEPEEHAFGGPAGMAIAHGLFCADSRAVLRYAHLDKPPIGRRELSVLLTIALLNAARLDWFEHGDVFARIASTARSCRHKRQASPAHQATAGPHRHPRSTRVDAHRTVPGRHALAGRLHRRRPRTQRQRPGRRARTRTASRTRPPGDLPLEPAWLARRNTRHPGPRHHRHLPAQGLAQPPCSMIGRSSHGAVTLHWDVGRQAIAAAEKISAVPVKGDRPRQGRGCVRILGRHVISSALAASSRASPADHADCSTP